MKLMTSGLLVVSLTACTAADDGDGPVGDSRRSLADCAAAGDALTEIWSVGNGHGAIGAMALSGDTVALAGADGSIKTWSLVSEQVDQVVGEPTEGVYGGEIEGEAPAFSALALAAGGVVGGDTLGGVGVYAMDGTVAARTNPSIYQVNSVSVHPDGGRIALATDAYAGEISEWDPITNTLAGPRTTVLWGVNRVAYDRSGERLLAAGDWYGVAAVELFAAGTDTSLGSWIDQQGGASRDIAGAALTAAGDRVLVAGHDFLEPAAGGFVAALDVAGMSADAGADVVVDQIDVADAGLIDLALSPDDAVIAVAATDGSVRLHLAGDLATHATTEVAASQVRFTADGGRLVTAGADGSLRLYACQ